MQNLQAVQSFVEKEKIECDLRVAHAIDVQLDDAHFAKLKGGLESIVMNGSEASKLVGMNAGGKAEAVCLFPTATVVEKHILTTASSLASKAHEAASATMQDDSGHTSLSCTSSKEQ